jgi:phage-related protein
MPRTDVKIYREAGGSVPLLEWLDKIPEKAQDKCIERIERLKEFGYELRRPHCDFLDAGIYELRAKYNNINYRILYGFVGRNIVLLSHGCSKERKVPKREIDRAVRNIKNYTQDPKAHTYVGEL